MKHLGPSQQFRGLYISLNHTRHTITISQEYINTILKRFEMVEDYGVQTPMDPNVRLWCDPQQGRAAVDLTHYQSIVGSLVYGTLGIRSDIACAVAALSRYNSPLLAIHPTAAKRVILHLKATKAARLCYGEDSNLICASEQLHAYRDAEWAGAWANRNSQDGFVFAMGGAAICWQSRK
jgi:hypothetical protein